MPLYIVLCQQRAYACIYWKKWRFGRVTPMPDILTHSQTTEYRATQLLSSIQFKLSHAICPTCITSFLCKQMENDGRNAISSNFGCRLPCKVNILIVNYKYLSSNPINASCCFLFSTFLCQPYFIITFAKALESVSSLCWLQNQTCQVVHGAFQIYKDV